MDNCPVGTITVDNTCQCDLSCEQCTYYMIDNYIECTKCRNSTDSIYKGLCVQNCPEDTYFIMSPYSIPPNQPFCLDRCPSFYMHYINATHKMCVRDCP